MKKFTPLLLTLALLLSLSACGSKTEPADTFTPPRAPEAFSDSYTELCISVGDMSVIASLLDAEEYSDNYHSGANAWTTLFSFDPESGESVYSRNGETSESFFKRTYNMKNDGRVKYAFEEKLKPHISRNPNNYEFNYESKGELISSWTGERSVGAVLDLIGNTDAGRTLDENKLKTALSFSGDAEDSTDPTGRVRSISATFTCGEIEKMLEADKTSDTLRAFFESFFNHSEPYDMTPAEEKTTLDKLRDSGDFSMSVRMTADAKTKRIQLADITARGSDSLVSVVYDGVSGDLEIVAEHSLGGLFEVSARYATVHEEGRREVELSVFDRQACDCPGGSITTEKEIALVRTNGTVYFSSALSEENSHIDPLTNEVVSEQNSYQSSIKLDSNDNTLTLTGGDIRLKLTLTDGGHLTGEAKNTKTGESTSLTFRSEQKDISTFHTLTNAGGLDVSAAEIVFRITR